MKLDPSRVGQLPSVAAPEPFADTASGIKGWKLTIPGGHPLATPAVVDGRIYMGGGFGSYEFYALDALTGQLAWQYQTGDDGPTAAVVAEERVVFNTESCEIEVLTTAGEHVWKKWLGDPLLSMPAVEAGHVYIAYPETHGDRHHYLACFALADGREIWRQQITGELITCPVLADGKVYATSLDGTLACFRQEDGEPLWHDEKIATSSTTVWHDECFFSQRKEHVVAGQRRQREHVSSKMSAMGTASHAFAGTMTDADYLDHERRASGSPMYAAYAESDAHVGFAGHKGDSKMHQAQAQLGIGHVSGVWAYQGARPFLSRGKLYSSIGDTVHCADPKSRDVFWKKRLRPGESETELLDTYLTPPAAVNGKLFLGTLEGRVVCLCADSGETLWSVEVGEPVMFQPAVVGGHVYASTHRGNLFCLETGDPADDGWHMWGATPAHNGIPADVPVMVG